MSEQKTNTILRAAQYLRMSSEHQRYSLANQRAAILQYAESRGVEVVRSYIDPARSGLTIRRRKGLQALLADVIAGSAGFDMVLVYDVSRWGRFLDHDESAHYEYMCRAAGVNVRYCAEPFENDGSPMSAIMKQLKRIMAGEFSRDLSERIHQAHMLLARMGYAQGGGLAFGVRRMLIDRHGNERGVLGRGERKALASDKIILVPGPDDELRVIRRIFRMYVDQRMSLPAIAEALTREGLFGVDDKPWNSGRLRSLLRNELARGYYVYNKSTRRLQTPQRRNPPELWVRLRIMAPIVSERIFNEAQRALSSRRGYGYRSEDLLKPLRRLAAQGRPLTARAIDACPYTPIATTYRNHFGNLRTAYERIGYTRPGFSWPKRAKRGCTDAEMLDGVRRIKAEHGYVTGGLIDCDRDLPNRNEFHRRFGSLMAAYEAAGISTNRSQVIVEARARAHAEKPAWNGRAPQSVNAASG